jgi:hypothetical protein
MIERQPVPVLYLACADELPPARSRRAAQGPPLLRRSPRRRHGIANAAEALGPRDPSRPIIEHYRRRDEIDVLVPLR